MQTLRQIKSYEKKYTKLLKKGEKKRAEDIKVRKPKMEFQHIIKERYPSFVDCLKDLDDALCLVFLYAKLPTHAFLGNGKYFLAN